MTHGEDLFIYEVDALLLKYTFFAIDIYNSHKHPCFQIVPQ